MSRVFRISVEQRYDEVAERERGYFKLPPSAIELMEAIFGAQQVDAAKFFKDQSRGYGGRYKWPWAIIVFEKDLPVTGHIAKMRGTRANISMTSYEWARLNYPTVISSSEPETSVITVTNKGILKRAAMESPLFGPAWEALKNCRRDRQWLVASDLPPQAWIDETAVGDVELFHKYRNLTSLDPSGPEDIEPALRRDYMAGMKHFLRNNAAECIELIEKVARQQSDLPDVWHMLGTSYLHVADFPKARSALKKALALAPTWLDTSRNLACACAMSGKMDKALEALRQIVELNPYDEWAWERIGDTERQAGRINEAIEAYKRYIELDGDSAQVHAYVCYELYRLRRDKEALEVCEEVLSLNPAEKLARNNYSYFLALNGKYEEALREGQRALADDPSYAFTYDNIGYAHLMMNQFDAAIEHFLKAIQLRERYPEAWRHLLHAYSRSGRDADYASARSYLLGLLPNEVDVAEREMAEGMIR